MNAPAPVVIQKRSFLSSLVLGLFGTISVIVICAAAVTIYAMKIVDERVDEIVGMAPQAITAVRDWQDALPPAMVDAIHDRRAPEYVAQLKASVEIVHSEHADIPHAVVEVENLGDQVVSLLSLRVVVEDANGVPVREFSTFAATPVAVEHSWRGPLLPETKRRFSIGSMYARNGSDEAGDISVEISEVRVWSRDGSSLATRTVSDSGGRIVLPPAEADDDTTTEKAASDDPDSEGTTTDDGTGGDNAAAS